VLLLLLLLLVPPLLLLAVHLVGAVLLAGVGAEAASTLAGDQGWLAHPARLRGWGAAIPATAWALGPTP
jgi:hypothetical protein